MGGALADITQMTGHKFVIIIDEWDVLIRDEAANLKMQEEYIDFLRGLFKGTEPTKFLHLAYLTGILPMKKVEKKGHGGQIDSGCLVQSLTEAGSYLQLFIFLLVAILLLVALS